jgi:hypothetical protein
MRIPAALALATALAACNADRPAPAADPAPTGAPAAPAPAPAAPPAAPVPADGADAQARFDGYGDLRFGMPADAMAAAWGGELKVLGKDANPTCYFMVPTWSKVPADFNFMVGEGRFARVGTESPKFLAPGGGRVGMTKADIATRYAGIQERPHHYTDGLYLRVRDPAGGPGVLVFETDGKGDDARVTAWRAGLPPEVDYVEGCS